MSNNTSNYQEYTFSKLLEQYDKILIPMIQRDYAQGRTDKKATDVRSNLLTDIFSDKNVHFDLVFGSKEKRIIDGKEKNCFIPVDGQQRLTTLFLLYLYGQKAGKTNTELDLSKFSYDTRRAASDFCKSITSEEWAVSNDKNVSDVIKDSSWFMNYWEKDPTVEGMLNMLDAIHEKCKKTIDYPNLDKVSFFFFDLESNGLNENLYLKMNSRGKPLTAFENLKAKMEKVLPEDVKIEDKCFPNCDASPKDSFKAKWKYFMDRNWTEAFWDSANPEKYDVSIAKFIVRFLSGYWAAFGNNDEKTTAEDLKIVNRKEQNDKNYSDYIQFEPIKAVLELNDAFPSLAYALTTAPKITSYWTNNAINVSDKSEYKFLTAIFTYVLFDGDKDAMRFAWNMAENYVTEYDTFVTYCKRAGEISNFKRIKKLTFYRALSSIEFVGNTSDQMKEEIAKAEQMLDGAPRSDGKTWEEIIIKAEKFVFFKGAIRFLFTPKDIGDDWEHFDAKWANAQEYFDKDGVKDGNENDKLYKSNALLMKSLLANCDDFGKRIWWHFEFSNDANRWKRILISGNWRNAVDAIMGVRVTTETTRKSIDAISKPYIKNIVDDGLMDYVCKYMPGAWIRSTYHDYHAIWQSGYPSYQIVLNPILSQLKFYNKIDYSDKNSIENCRYYKCVDKNVDFKYGCHFFRWWGYPNEKELDVYLMENDWANYKERPNPTSDKGTDEDRYYCFRVTKDMESDPSKFTDALDELIKKLQIS
ncbi:DUF262 domain-containing protein [Segatella bryantii]|uniref:DUF262 domain-containing protein n=1 Tax=Segatella bryantii TaxID=77095 RepID=UPI0008896FAA|nr:DUF262 domain-containing protein [Segatella bryantii]SDL58125.1 Protein of unknown function DUF262 [Segatella bryantii]